MQLPGGGLTSLHKSVLEVCQTSYGSCTSAAAPETLSPGNMSIPAAGARILLQEPVLPTEVAELLRQPDVFDLPAELLPRRLPLRCLRATNNADVLAKLWDTGLLEACPEEAVRRHRGEVIRAGLFGVAKKLSDKRRVIVDRRMRNACEKDFQAFW